MRQNFPIRCQMKQVSLGSLGGGLDGNQPLEYGGQASDLILWPGRQMHFTKVMNYAVVVALLHG